VTVRLPVYDERKRRFARLRDRNVFVYWPHGLGDWAHLAAMLPFFERSNRYAIGRYGDDYVALIEGNAYARPVYTGVRTISDGSDAGARHLGLDWKRINAGKTYEISIPRFEQTFERERFDALLYTDYPEREGRTAFPFHTKARALLRDLVDLGDEQLAMLQRPLPSTLAFRTNAALQDAVDERLRRLAEPGERLALLVHTGHTAERKNWNEVQAGRFAEIAGSESWRVFRFDRDYAKLFGDLDAPFASILIALLRRAQLVAGVPTGPLHVALAYAQTPVVGIWLAHHPDWYEERSENAVHLLGKTIFERRYERRPATASLPQALRNRTIAFEREPIEAEAVWQAARDLLG
jgi:hypothetical protein